MIRIAYLGPAGTFSEEALRIAVGDADYEPMPQATIHAAVLAVEEGSADRALVPFENSIEGTVRPALDALAFDTSRVRIVGELDHAISQALIAARELPLPEIEMVLSHPQPIAQCARFLRECLPAAEVRTVSSTTEAIRTVSASDRPLAALGVASAAAGYGCVVLREGVEDEEGNVTRFVWLAPEGDGPEGEGIEEPVSVAVGPQWRTTLVFSELGADHPGALVDALAEISGRGINMTRIESRPRRSGLGEYLFFIDLDGREEDVAAEGIEALREKAGIVRVLGSYPTSAAQAPPPL